MQLHRKFKRRRKQKARSKFNRVKLQGNKLRNHKLVKTSFSRNKASGSTIYLRKFDYPYYSRKRSYGPSHQRSNDYEYVDYDYTSPIKFSLRNYYYDDFYDYDDEYNRRTYFHFKRGYGGNHHKPSSYNLLPLLAMLGLVGLLLNLGLGKIKKYCLLFI